MGSLADSAFHRLDAVEQLRALADSFPGILSVFDHELRVVFAGGERPSSLGYSRRTMEGRTLSELFPGAVSALAEPYFRAALAGERTSFEGEVGEAVYRTELAPLRKGDEVIGVISLASDVTARVEADRQLHELNAEFESILTHAPIGLALVDLDGGWIRVNNRVCEIVGYSREELLTKSFQEITHPDDLGTDLDNLQALLTGEIATYGIEKRYFHKRGHLIWIWLSVSVIHDEHGKPLHFVTQIEEITARKSAERYLEAERAVTSALAGVPTVAEALARVVEAIATTMDWDLGEAWLLDGQGAEAVCAGTWSSTEALSSLSRNTQTGRWARGESSSGTVWDRQEPLWFSAADSDEWFGRANLARSAGLSSGVGIPLLSDGQAIGAIGFFSRRKRQADPQLLEMMHRLGDQIGEFFARRRAEEERQALALRLLESQGRERLGVLAGGVAHDFNNLLVGVLGNASLLREELPLDSPLRDLAEQIELAASRAAGLTGQMLAYSGQGRFVLGAVDVSRAAADTAELVQPALPHLARLDLDLDDSLPAIRADSAQIDQLFTNLFTNAAEALGAGGVVSVRTALVHADRELLDGFRLGHELAPGPYVLIEIADDGCGMTVEVLERIFEPYFTTKFTGRGLGLAASLGIVRGHRGALRVTSAPDAGTTFVILLPTSVAEPPRALAPAPTGGRTVLVVDDEEVVRLVAERALTNGGYTVLAAEDGAGALEVYRQRRGEIACVLLDLTMPGMPGEEVLRSLRSIDPDVRIVLSSGYAPGDVGADAGVGFLQKPYALDELLEAVAAATAPSL